jgi:hypothetical protein
MTEAEWLTCTDPEEMLQHLGKDWKHAPWQVGRWAGLLRHNGKERNLRLFAWACYRRAWDELERAETKRAVEVAERYADGVATEKELAAAGKTLGLPEPVTLKFAMDAARHAASYAVLCLASDVFSAAARQTVYASLGCLLRDVFGNPFRRTGRVVDRAARTSGAILKLARVISGACSTHLPPATCSKWPASCRHDTRASAAWAAVKDTRTRATAARARSSGLRLMGNSPW